MKFFKNFSDVDFDFSSANEVFQFYAAQAAPQAKAHATPVFNVELFNDYVNLFTYKENTATQPAVASVEYLAAMHKAVLVQGYSANTSLAVLSTITQEVQHDYIELIGTQHNITEGI